MIMLPVFQIQYIVDTGNVSLLHRPLTPKMHNYDESSVLVDGLFELAVSGDLVPYTSGKKYNFGYKGLVSDDRCRYWPVVLQRRIPLAESRDRSKLIDTDEFGRRYELTAWETQILHCVYQGLYNAEIDRILASEIATLERHFYSIYGEYVAKNRMQLVFALAG